MMDPAIDYEARLEVIKITLAELLVLHGILSEQIMKTEDTMSPKEAELLVQNFDRYARLERGLSELGFSSEEFLRLMMKKSQEEERSYAKVALN